MRARLDSILQILSIDTVTHGFHTYRRSGATLAAQLEVPLENIMQFGTWQSGAIKSYRILLTTTLSRQHFSPF